MTVSPLSISPLHYSLSGFLNLVKMNPYKKLGRFQEVIGINTEIFHDQ